MMPTCIIIGIGRCFGTGEDDLFTFFPSSKLPSEITKQSVSALGWRFSKFKFRQLGLFGLSLRDAWSTSPSKQQTGRRDAQISWPRFLVWLDWLRISFGESWLRRVKKLLQRFWVSMPVITNMRSQSFSSCSLWVIIHVGLHQPSREIFVFASWLWM